MYGADVWVEGVVVGDFQNYNQLKGIFLQDPAGDGDSATSDGIFVYLGSSGYEFFPDVAEGDLVRLYGEVGEYNSQTQVTWDSSSTASICDSGIKVKPTKMILPVAELAEWESAEGMLVELPQKLSVSGNYNQGYRGEVDLAFNWPLDTPTNVVAPGADAAALQDLNDRSRIQLDDGTSWTNYELPYFYDDPGYRTLRTGDKLKKPLVGALGQYYDYEIHPTMPVVFQPHNPRPDGPPNTLGTLTVASFNMLNFFTTIDYYGTWNEICGPNADQDCRGADSTTEYDRQLAKLLAALVGLDADIIGLQEIENHPEHVPITTLVAELNAADPSTDSWTWVGPVDPYNNYVIRNEIIFRADRVNQIGGPLTVSDFVFDEEHPSTSRIDPLGRPPVAQTFEFGDEVFTVVVNHLKSKSCGGYGHNGGLDDDLGDGQGCWNEQRRLQAVRTMEFAEELMATDPDVLVIGDMNSYAQEDPIGVFTDAGFTDLLANKRPAGWTGGDYSYNYFSQSGYLDHALATPSLMRQVTGAAFWAINADEPNGLNYNTYNDWDLYSPDEFRSSDHDPVLIGLRLGK